MVIYGTIEGRVGPSIRNLTGEWIIMASYARKWNRFTVSWAYDQVRDQGPKAFPAHLRDPKQLAWAFVRARQIDNHHETEYPECNDPYIGDFLKQLVYENVRMWAEVWLKR